MSGFMSMCVCVCGKGTGERPVPSPSAQTRVQLALLPGSLIGSQGLLEKFLPCPNC